MLYDDATAEQTYELYGPKNYSTAEIAELVDKEIIKHRRHVNVPKRILKPIAGVLNKAIWWPTTSADEVEREFIDQEIDPTAKTFRDLGITPAEISSLTFHYLVCAHQPGRMKNTNTTYSKDTEAQLSMIFHQQRRERRGKRRSICTSLTTNRYQAWFEETCTLGSLELVNMSKRVILSMCCNVAVCII